MTAVSNRRGIAEVAGVATTGAVTSRPAAVSSVSDGREDDEDNVIFHHGDHRRPSNKPAEDGQGKKTHSHLQGNNCRAVGKGKVSCVPEVARLRSRTRPEARRWTVGKE